MLTIETTPDMSPFVMRASPTHPMSDGEFFEFCQLNPELRMERTAEGEIIMMTPAGGETGSRNAALTAALFFWAKEDGEGVAFDSSTGFILPNGAIRAPDAAWVRRSRLARLTPEEKQRFLPLCPDFVIELRSPTDRLEELQAKMEEYRDNGARLGWLIDPEERQAFVYRPGRSVERLQEPSVLTGDPALPGFTLAMVDIWEPDF